MYIDEVMPLNDILKSVRHNIFRMIFTLRVYVNNTMLCFHDLHKTAQGLQKTDIEKIIERA